MKIPRMAQTVLSNEGTGGHITTPEFGLHYRAIIIKHTLVEAFKKSRHSDHWNRIEDPVINPRTYRYLMFDQETKSHTKEKTASLINDADKILIKKKNEILISGCAQNSTTMDQGPHPNT